MDQRGRKSFSSQGLHIVHVSGEWPKAPTGLTPFQAANWDAVVHTKPSDWFGPDNYPLLVEYVRAIDTADAIAVSLNGFDPSWMNDPEGLKRFKELSKMQKGTAASMALLATKMRLAQQSRYTEGRAATEARKAGSGPTVRPWERTPPGAKTTSAGSNRTATSPKGDSSANPSD